VMMIQPVVVLSVQVHRWIFQGLREFDSERIMILWVNQQAQHELSTCFDPTEFVYKTAWLSDKKVTMEHLYFLQCFEPVVFISNSYIKHYSRNPILIALPIFPVGEMNLPSFISFHITVSTQSFQNLFTFTCMSILCSFIT